MNNILFFLTLFFRGCNQPEKELFLIPNNYKSTVAIIFSIKDGDSRTYLDGFRGYKIPASGVLFTQFANNTGDFPIGDIRYKYVNGEDTLLIKEYDIGTKDDTSSLPQIFAVQSGMFGDKNMSIERLLFVLMRNWKIMLRIHQAFWTMIKG